MKPIVFISHTHSESKLAIWLKEQISELLLGAIDFFVSSDKSSIVGGDKWLSKIEDGLKSASIIIVICSRESVLKPWINFEAGGAWMAGKRVVPVCHSDMSPGNLPEPLKSLLAYEMTNEKNFQELVALLAQEAGLRVPKFDAKKLLSSLPQLEPDASIDQALQLIEIFDCQEKVGTGWIIPKPDQRDLTVNDSRVVAFMREMSIPTEKTKKKLVSIPSSVDLRQWCSAIKNQGRINSSTAHAAVGMIEYYEQRALGRHVELSTLFVYKHARNLMHNVGDSGAMFRSTLQAISLFGVPSSKTWPYTDKKPDYDSMPPAHVYPMAFNYQNVIYFCVDPMHMDFPTSFVLSKVKTFLAAGIVSAFGFFVYPSFEASGIVGAIPYPCPEETPRWQHAVLAVGYDDEIKIKNTQCNKQTTGALLIRNSWGNKWGDKGYGWIPYDYLLSRQAFDFWLILKPEWVDTKSFGL